MIHLLLDDDFFSSADAVKNVGLVVVISVDSGTEELLLRVVVLLEGLRKAENRVGRGSLQLRPNGERSDSAVERTLSQKLRCYLRKHD